MDNRILRSCPNPFCVQDQHKVVLDTRIWPIELDRQKNNERDCRVYCSCGIIGKAFRTEAEAIDFWNTRPLLTAEPEPCENDKIEWILAEKKLPPLDTTVWVCVRNKNKSDGIWLHDICWHDGKSWGKREHTWETIVYWALPISPDRRKS